MRLLDTVSIPLLQNSSHTVLAFYTRKLQRIFGHLLHGPQNTPLTLFPFIRIWHDKNLSESTQGAIFP